METTTMTTQTTRPQAIQAETLETLELRLADIEDDIEIMRQSNSLAKGDMIATYCTKARILRNRIARLRTLEQHYPALHLIGKL
jgi:hypothetical protein